jgi:hypothetical protein
LPSLSKWARFMLIGDRAMELLSADWHKGRAVG